MEPLISESGEKRILPPISSIFNQPGANQSHYSRSESLEPVNESIITTNSQDLPKAKVKRPPNAFFMYRAHMSRVMRNLNGRQLSKEASTRWANEKPEVKQLFTQMAESNRKRHFKAFPDFKWFSDKCRIKASEKRRQTTILQFSNEKEPPPIEKGSVVMSINNLLC